MFQAGLVLEGGGMRGVYTAGVLDFFLEQGVKFASVYGVSAGAIQACSYLSGQKGRGYACIADYVNDWRYMSFRMWLLTGNLFGAKMCYDTIPNRLYPFDYDAFQSQPSRLYAVLTEVRTGKPAYRQVQDMRRETGVIRASGSLPFLSRMVKVDGQRMLDGGVADSIPLEKAIGDGHGRNVVILTQDPAYRKRGTKGHFMANLRYPLRRALRQRMADRPVRYNEQLDFVRQMQAEGRAFVIQPEQPVGFSRLEKDKAKLEALYRQGYDDAGRLYPAMMAYLQKSPNREQEDSK